MRVFHNSVIEFAANDEINVLARQQTFRRLDLHLGPDEADLDSRLLVFHRASHAQVAEETHRGGKQNDELVVLRYAHNFLGRYVMRRPVQQAAPGKHTRGVGQPNRIPIGFNLTCGGPARTRSAVEFLEAGRI